jgi:hypothetical protein
MLFKELKELKTLIEIKNDEPQHFLVRCCVSLLSTSKLSYLHFLMGMHPSCQQARVCLTHRQFHRH